MPAYYEWKFWKKTYTHNEKPGFAVSNHPLKINTVTIKQGVNKDFIENLNRWSSPFEVADPLLRFEQMNIEESFQKDNNDENNINYCKSWSKRRGDILQRYTTGDKLTIVSSYLPGGEKALIRQVSNLNEKVKHRLEQLDEFEEGSEKKTMGLSQQEFVNKINVLNDEIKKAWDTEQRVKAFKIAIQCSKLLFDTSVMQFYPSKFVLITDVLDMFGDLVFDRLKSKSFGEKPIKHVNDIDPNLVPDTAKETCTNWIYKMASIRELLPRLYMEMALLKCYAFLSKNEIKSAISRITLMIRGIGDPLVAVYLRLHLCRIASRLLDNPEEHFLDNFNEVRNDYQQIFDPFLKKTYESQSLTLNRYLSIYVPAIDWILFGACNSKRCKATLLEEFLTQCDGMSNHDLMLYCFLSAFDSETIAMHSPKILDMIQDSSDAMVMTCELLSFLGEHLCSASTYDELPMETLVDYWINIANNIPTAQGFLQVLEPWAQITCRYLSSNYVNLILRNTIRYIANSAKPPHEFTTQFQFIIKRIMNTMPDVEEVLLMDAFMPLLEMIQAGNTRPLIAKTVLSSFFERYTAEFIDDYVIISSLMTLCCVLHDSISALTVEDEKKVYADLIIKFVQRVNHPDGLEQQLNYYVDSRAAFIKLDAVLVALVHAVNKLSIVAQSEWLQRACAAYCFITVPSLHCALTKVRLYLIGGQVALLNRCFGQSEANFKALVSLIPDIPDYIYEDNQKNTTHVKMIGLLSDFLSTLLVLPDNVDSNCKAYVLSGFIKLMERIHWRKTDTLYYTTLLHTIDLLCAMAQDDYAYHIESVLSNDVLYGSNKEFMKTIETYATNICQELLVVLKSLADANEIKKQNSLSLELFWRVITRADLNEPAMFSLATNLWMLCQKSKEHQSKLAKSMLTLGDDDGKYEARSKLLKTLEETLK